MQIAIHAGVHATDEDRLVRGLLKNREALAGAGICVPGPSRYRRALRDVLHELTRAAPPEGAREALLAQIAEGPAPDQRPERLVLSHENLFCVPKLTLQDAQLYRQAESRLADLSALFPDDQIELFLGLRNPASWIPELFRLIPEEDFTTFLGAVEVRELFWSDLVRRLRGAAPEVRLTVWCNEDTPLIWGEILRRMTGLPSEAPVAGGWDILREIMAPEGLTRFRQFLDTHPGIDEAQRRRAAETILATYAMPEVLTQSIALPGWTPELVAELTQRYEGDLENVAAIGGVHLIRP
ncbi:hypothetical protein KM176_16715 [Pseudooceanicola sp. CBS1P-1]|uniref:Uncharacterized protein n=1 Tax=Pseudooceanicola albus TaxID=2692189 RepID=A0A6L7G707_9RHOB|nr:MULTISPECIES: hypothetical protein [Pseudooceanicola]MBT9385518.1 hypothetical protein [Pseudooceanicola endophyticus]MXN19070.1 hypothetical protein [Pseudooceanicola albus]